MTANKTKLQKIDSLIDQNVNDPQNRQDILPFPYSMINDVLNETIMYKLNLRMHQIQQKKKDDNYQGPVREYVGQNLMDIEGISTLSQPQKTHNHLLAGDKFGNVYLLDLAKRTVFSKKQIAPGKKVIWISDSIITDGDTSITTAAVINHSHHVITIIRYRYSQPKLFITDQVHVAADSSDPNNLPYSCQLHDFCRLLSVKTYNGQIRVFRLPELTLDVQKKTKSGSIPLEQQQIKKILKYPLQMAILQSQVRKNSQKALQINFKGDKITPKYNDVKARLLGMKKTAPPVEQPVKKDPKKKQQKAPQPVKQKTEPIVQFNKKIVASPVQQINGVDCSINYQIPYYEPFIYFIEQEFSMPKTKYFEKGKTVPLPSFVIYGWKNTKQFYIGRFQQPTLDYVPQFLQVGYYQQVISEPKAKILKDYSIKKIQLLNQQVFKNVHPITATGLSFPDKSLIAFGLRDGTVSIWNPVSQNLQFNTEKHTQHVTCLAFFEKWKLVSGDANNEVFIHNVVNRRTQMKRTNIFQPKQPIPITAIQINDLGIAYCLDAQSNMRVFDLWRNQKISKISPCTPYALMEDKGRKWLPIHSVKSCSTIYTNRDFTVLISVNWPSIAPRVQDRTPQQVKKIKEISQNPWRIPGTNTHIIRNFEFLLSLFQGLQSVYKKGYQRKKIQNLFSNLQFAQLNDRTFEIPDFSKPQGGTTQLKKKDSIINKSLFSANRTSQRSLSTSKSKQKLGKDGTQQIRLTSQVLHPQKFLFERRKINKDLLLTKQGLVDWLRQQHSKKQLRQTKLNSDTSKSMF